MHKGKRTFIANDDPTHMNTTPKRAITPCQYFLDMTCFVSDMNEQKKEEKYYSKKLEILSWNSLAHFLYE